MKKKSPSSLSILNTISVKSPCHESWATMPGDEKERHCAKCDHTVYNLSALDGESASKLVREATSRLCVRYESDGSGKPIFQPAREVIVPRSAAARYAARFAAALASLLFGVTPLSSRADEVAQPVPDITTSQHTGPREELLGDVALVDETPSPTPTATPASPPTPTPSRETQMTMGKICVKK